MSAALSVAQRADVKFDEPRQIDSLEGIEEVHAPFYHPVGALPQSSIRSRVALFAGSLALWTGLRLAAGCHARGEYVAKAGGDDRGRVVAI